MVAVSNDRHKSEKQIIISTMIIRLKESTISVISCMLLSLRQGKSSLLSGCTLVLLTVLSIYPSGIIKDKRNGIVTKAILISPHNLAIQKAHKAKEKSKIKPIAPTCCQLYDPLIWLRNQCFRT